MLQALYNLNPIAITIGNMNIYWYGLAYILALVIGQRYVSRQLPQLNVQALSQYMAIGILCGGKLAEVILYNLNALLARGGMSFHGGLIGSIIAGYIYCQRYKIPSHIVSSLKIAIIQIVPLGLFLGRIANAINNEMIGTEYTGWLSVYYAGALRHPVSVYQALCEGPLLWLLIRQKRVQISISQFVIYYSLLRIMTEYFKQSTTYSIWWNVCALLTIFCIAYRQRSKPIWLLSIIAVMFLCLRPMNLGQIYSVMSIILTSFASW